MTQPDTIAFALLFFAALALAVAAWLWGPPLSTALRRARVRRQPFPRAWREILRRRMPGFVRLPADVQLQLKKHAQVLLAEKPFIGCAGLVVSDEMRVLIATQAALLLLNRRAGYFSALRQVLVYPGAFVVDRTAIDPAGLARDERRVLSGESWQQGQVILSWDDVLAGAADPADGPTRRITHAGGESVVPADPQRIVVLAQAHYFRGRAGWHLLPHRALWEPARDLPPHAGLLRAGDFVVVWQRPGAQFDLASGRLRFENGVDLPAKLLLSERDAAVFAIL